MISCWVFFLFWWFLLVSLNERTIKTYYSLIRLSFLRGLRPTMVTYWHEISCISSYVFLFYAKFCCSEGDKLGLKKRKMIYCHIVFWLLRFIIRPSLVCNMISCWVFSLFWCFIFVSLNKRAIKTYYSLIRLSFLRGLRPTMVTYWHEISCISSYVFCSTPSFAAQRETNLA